MKEQSKDKVLTLNLEFERLPKWFRHLCIFESSTMKNPNQTFKEKYNHVVETIGKKNADTIVDMLIKFKDTLVGTKREDTGRERIEGYVQIYKEVSKIGNEQRRENKQFSGAGKKQGSGYQNKQNSNGKTTNTARTNKR